MAESVAPVHRPADAKPRPPVHGPHDPIPVDGEPAAVGGESAAYGAIHHEVMAAAAGSAAAGASDASTNVGAFLYRLDGGRRRQATLQLQRTAGNKTVTRALRRDRRGRRATAPPANVQRNVPPPGTKPDEELIKEGIDKNDPGPIKLVQNLGAAKFEDKIKMIHVLAYQGWVGPRDETALEILWGSFGNGVLDVAKGNPDHWKKSLEGGAELYNLAPVKPLANKFLVDVRGIAGGYLDANEKYTVDELRKLGVQEEGDKTPAPSAEEQANRQAELTAAIRIATEARTAQEQLRNVVVSLERRYNMFNDSQLYFPGGFDPAKPPDPKDETPDPSRVEKAKAAGLTEAALRRTPWKDVKAQYDVLEAIMQGLSIAYPAAGIALMAPAPQAGRAGGEDPKAAKTAIVGMLGGARDAIRATRPKLAGGLAYELSPIHNQLFAGGSKGGSGVDWKDPVAQAVAKEVLELKSNVEFWKSMGLATLAAAAFILAEFATAGLATVALVGFGVGLGAGQAIVAWEKALEMQAAEKATTGGGTELLSSGQASMAMFEAALATVMVFVDAAMAAKPVGRALTGVVDKAALAAGAKAASKISEELIAMAGKAPDRALIERGIAELGAEAVASKTGKSMGELLAILGEDSPYAARLKALAAVPADLTKLSAPELAKRASNLAAEIAADKTTGEALATLAIERLGPKKVLDMNGGWKALSLAMGNESVAGKSIMAWRDGMMGDIEAFVKTLPGGVDETGAVAVKRTGSQGKFTNDFDVSLLGPHASQNRNAVRSFMAGRVGTTPDRLGQTLLADFFTDPRRLHLYDQLDEALRAEVGARAEKVAESTIMNKTLYDAEQAGNKELAAQIRKQMEQLGVPEVAYRPLGDADRAALYTKIDDLHQQLETALAASDKAAQRKIVEQIGDTQGLINATEGGGYFSGGATRQIVTLAEGLLKGSTKPMDAQVYTALLDQLPKLNAEASALLKTGFVATEDAVGAIKGLAKYGKRFRELMAKLDVKVADEGLWNDLANKLGDILHQAKGEADVTLLSRLETNAKSVEDEVTGLMSQFRAQSQEVLMTLSRQAAIGAQQVDLQAIQFLVMATAKLTRASSAVKASMKLIIAQIAEAGLAAQKRAAAEPANTPADQSNTPPPTAQPSIADGASSGMPMSRRARRAQRAASR